MLKKIWNSLAGVIITFMAITIIIAILAGCDAELILKIGNLWIDILVLYGIFRGIRFFVKRQFEE